MITAYHDKTPNPNQPEPYRASMRLPRTRYVVDSVSRGGEHKVVALWRYDKRDYYGSRSLG